jgi:hypothetical protein
MANFRNRAIKTTVSILSLYLILAGCKSKDEGGDQATVKTLDNFARSPKAGTPIRTNHCGPEKGAAGSKEKLALFEDSRIVWPTEGGLWTAEAIAKLKEETHSVLGQIPPALLLQFHAFDGKIDLSHTPGENNLDTVTSNCIQSLDPATTRFLFNDLLLSCWSQDPKTNAITIFIDPASNGVDGFTGIHHALVRSFGFVLSQVLFNNDFEYAPPALALTGADAAKEDTGKYSFTPKGKPSANDMAFLENLTNSLWKDVYGKSRVEGLDSEEKLAALVKEKEGGFKFDLSNFQDLYFSAEKNSRTQYQFFVFAEAFDSYYCSEDTRKQMREEFPESYCQIKLLDYGLNPKIDSNMTEEKNGALGKLVNELAAGRSASDEKKCSWETPVEADKKEEPAQFALGNPGGNTKTSGQSSGQQVTYGPPSGPYNAGYSSSGSYGGASVPPGCYVGCSSGGFFSSILGGVGAFVGGAIDIVTSPIAAIFHGVHAGIQPYGGGVGVNYGYGYGGGGYNGGGYNGGFYNGGGSNGGGYNVGYNGGPIFGGGVYGRPYPPIQQQGGWNSSYPPPCYAAQAQYKATSPFQLQYEQQYGSQFGPQYGQQYGQLYGQQFRAGSSFYLGQPISQNPGQYPNNPNYNYNQNYNNPNYNQNYDNQNYNNQNYNNYPNYNNGYAYQNYPQVSNLPSYCAPQYQYQGYPENNGVPIKGGSGLAVTTSNNTSAVNPPAATASTAYDYKNTSSYDSSRNGVSTGNSSGVSQPPVTRPVAKKSSSNFGSCGTLGLAGTLTLEPFLLLLLGMFMPFMINNFGRRRQK